MVRNRWEANMKTYWIKQKSLERTTPLYHPWENNFFVKVKNQIIIALKLPIILNYSSRLGLVWNSCRGYPPPFLSSLAFILFFHPSIWSTCYLSLQDPIATMLWIRWELNASNTRMAEVAKIYRHECCHQSHCHPVGGLKFNTYKNRKIVK